MFRLLYLYNCGVLLSYGQSSILIDGIFEKDNDFDKMPDEYEKALFCGEYPFGNVEALLFTHCHADHYSPELVNRYAEAFPETAVISPETVLKADTGSIECGDFEISYFETGHIPTGMEEGKHYVFGIRVGNRRIVLTGDMDPDKLDVIAGKYGRGADVFFINPALLLYEMKRADKTLLRSVKNLYVYHLPSETRDIYGYRKAALSISRKIEKHLGNVTLMLDNMQEKAE